MTMGILLYPMATAHHHHLLDLLNPTMTALTTKVSLEEFTRLLESGMMVDATVPTSGVLKRRLMI
jgi:hypothetical protein